MPADHYRNFTFDARTEYKIDAVTVERGAYVLRVNRDTIWTFVNYGQEASFAFSRKFKDPWAPPGLQIPLGEAKMSLLS